MLTIILAAARKVPLWIWALTLVLVWGAWQKHEATAAANTLRQHDAEVAAETLKASQAAQAETQRRLTAQREVTDEATRQAAVAASAAAGARTALERLRAQLAASAPSRSASDPAPAGGRQAAVMVDVLGQCAGRLQVVAAVADDAINRGRACEAAYGSLTKGESK